MVIRFLENFSQKKQGGGKIIGDFTPPWRFDDRFSRHTFGMKGESEVKTCSETIGICEAKYLLRKFLYQ